MNAGKRHGSFRAMHVTWASLWQMVPKSKSLLRREPRKGLLCAYDGIEILVSVLTGIRLTTVRQFVTARLASCVMTPNQIYVSKQSNASFEPGKPYLFDRINERKQHNSINQAIMMTSRYCCSSRFRVRNSLAILNANVHVKQVKPTQL